jgi:hypothetical protein
MGTGNTLILTANQAHSLGLTEEIYQRRANEQMAKPLESHRQLHGPMPQ